MQSVLVKQHVLDALGIIEKKQKIEEISQNTKIKFVKRKGQESSESSSSYESSSDEDSDSEEESSDENTGLQEDDLQFDNGKEEEKYNNGTVLVNDDELLLDNYYVRVNSDGSRTRVPKPKVSIQAMQEEYVMKKSLQEYELQLKKQEEEKRRIMAEEAEEQRRQEEKKKQFHLVQDVNKSKEVQMKEIKQKQEEAMMIIKNEMSDQQMSLQERLKLRKQNMKNKKMDDNSKNNIQNDGSKSNNISSGNPNMFIQSPNLSNIQSELNQNSNNYQQSPINQRENASSSDSKDDLDDNMILKNLECDLDPDQIQQEEMIYDEDDDDTAEALQEIEKRKEEIMEEFYEIAFQKKHEYIEEVKTDCKKNKIKKDIEKKRIQEMQAIMDTKRKEGVSEVNKKLNLIILDEEISIQEKVARLQEVDQIRNYMNAYFDKEEEKESKSVEQVIAE